LCQHPLEHLLHHVTVTSRQQLLEHGTAEQHSAVPITSSSLPQAKGMLTLQTAGT
jgi:hypothetical protein